MAIPATKGAGSNNQTLSDLRKDKGFSLADVGKQLNIDRSFVSYIERAERTLKIERAEELARIYGVDLDTILRLYNNAKLKG